MGKDGEFKEIFSRESDSDEIAEIIYRTIEEESSFSFTKLFNKFKGLWFGFD